ncbi:uncharacterized protein BX664DRAFT_35456 [Halteromyces radiatus]|uniref:uncharacterized protein n=1 Tax=Halteromyces radiatus TaxID=101107 RepID=UPI00221ED8C3|nr:uncharacterized protein BX664DRAFT_35456 [Halteromyces radiatus]KAI8100191.1 hypothetical protein BX664DRAFT_35456 [Halteromyces radiatus]
MIFLLMYTIVITIILVLYSITTTMTITIITLIIFHHCILTISLILPFIHLIATMDIYQTQIQQHLAKKGMHKMIFVLQLWIERIKPRLTIIHLTCMWNRKPIPSKHQVLHQVHINLDNAVYLPWPTLDDLVYMVIE